MLQLIVYIATLVHYMEAQIHAHTTACHLVVCLRIILYIPVCYQYILTQCRSTVMGSFFQVYISVLGAALGVALY